MADPGLDAIVRQRQRSKHVGELASGGVSTSHGAIVVGAPRHHGGGIFGAIGHVIGQTGSDLYHAAVNTPAGLVYLGKGLATHPLRTGEQVVQSTVDDLKHPLRHPGYTLLDVLGIAGGVAGVATRAGATAAALERGASAGEIARAALTRGVPAARELRSGGLTVKVPASKAPLTRLAQKGTDTLLHRAAEKNPAGRGARVLDRKIGKAVTEQGRAQEAIFKGPGAALVAIGRKLNPAEQKALQVVAEEAPLHERITAASARVTGAKDAKARARHQAELDLLHQAKPLLGDENGKPTFTGKTAPKLAGVLTKMRGVAGSREELLKSLELLTDESIQGRKTDAARIAMGGAANVPAPPGPHAQAVKSFAQYLRNHPDKAAAEYFHRHGDVIDTDLVRSLSTDYEQKPHLRAAMSAPMHESASAFAKELYARKLAEPAKHGIVEITSGGAGAGKSTVRQLFQRPADVVLDTTLSDPRTAATKIEQALKSGRRVVVTYVYRPSAEALRAAVARAAHDKRPVPLNYFAKSHVGANRTIRALERRYRNDPRVDIRIVRNEAGKSHEATLADIPKLTYNEVADEVTGTYQHEVAAGNVPNDVAAGFDDGRGVQGPKRQPDRGGRQGLERARPAQPAALADSFVASPDALRIPDVAKKPPKSGSVKTGSGGIVGRPREPGSVTHRYTGALREHALRRQDTAQLVGESGIEAGRYAALHHVVDMAKQASRAEPLRPNDLAVRLDEMGKNEKMPAALRAYTADPHEFFQHATAAEKNTVFEQLRSRLVIDPKKLNPEQAAEFQRLHDEGKIGFVPRAILGDFAKPQAPLSAVAGTRAVRSVDAINNASRFAILYLKPAYAIPNLLGNAALNIVQQGFAAPANLGRAVALTWRIGPELSARVDTLMGEGFARAVSAHGQGALSKTVDRAASIWSKGVDQPFRRAAFIHEARAAGYRTPSQLERLLTDPALNDELVHVTVRANREIIDYAALTPAEREIVRRVVFFYPWVKGSTRYAAHFVKEHPVGAGVAGQVGKQGQQWTQDTLGPVPSYLEGIFPVGDKVSNPASAAILNTPAQVGAAIAGLLHGNVSEAAQLSNFASPALNLALSEIARRNLSTGAAYPGKASGLDIAKDTLVNRLPQATLLHNIEAAVSGKGGSKLYPPSVMSAIEQFLVGSIAPRKVNRSRLRALAIQELRAQQHAR